MDVIKTYVGAVHKWRP